MPSSRRSPASPRPERQLEAVCAHILTAHPGVPTSWPLNDSDVRPRCPLCPVFTFEQQLPAVVTPRLHADARLAVLLIAIGVAATSSYVDRMPQVTRVSRGRRKSRISRSILQRVYQ